MDAPAKRGCVHGMSGEANNQTRWRWLVFISFVLIAGFAGWWIMFSDLLTEKYATFESPDGQYRIEVLRNKQLLASGPGQAGDAPGEVRLCNKAGDVLEKTDVEMVQLVENVEWTDTSVYIKFVADWTLPEKK